MEYLLLFLLGSAVGSFLGVLAMRYHEDEPLFARRVWSGRSFCEGCGKTLRWFELVPLASYIVQGGRCRSCRMRLSLQYPVIELISGALFVAVPIHFSSYFQADFWSGALWTVLWLVVWSALLLISLIDFRLHLIPDELNFLLGVLGVVMIAWLSVSAPAESSFLGKYALLLGTPQRVWLSHVLAAVFSSGFLGFLILITRGRGMGIGDVKLAAALGLIFGWPDIALILFLSFVLGAAVGLLAIATHRKGLKSAVAFGPFLALGAFVVFFWGYVLVSGYFGLLSI